MVLCHILRVNANITAFSPFSSQYPELCRSDNLEKSVESMTVVQEILGNQNSTSVHKTSLSCRCLTDMELL